MGLSRIHYSLVVRNKGNVMPFCLHCQPLSSTDGDRDHVTHFLALDEMLVEEHTTTQHSTAQHSRR
jgi:hypothetical protein